MLDAAALARRREQSADLVQIASAEVDWLYDYIAKSGYALVLTDAVMEKFGGDSVEETGRNLRSYLDNLAFS